MKPFLAVVLALLAPLCCQSAAATTPNIVFILADDLGWTDLACYGSKYYETPNLDRMAAQGMKFTSGYACGPNCQPTRAALMSGRYAARNGVYTVGGIDRFNWRSRSLRPVDNVVNLPLEHITVGQAVKNAGYNTGYFGKWHLGQAGGFHPSKRGFDEAITSKGVHFNFNTQPKVQYPKDIYLADWLTDKSVDFIRRHQEKPFFLVLSHFAVHTPLQARPDWADHFKPKSPVGGHQDPTYAGMIASVDESVGRIMALLDELKLSDNTLLIFSSDNGGVGGYEREGIKSSDITDNAPLRSGKGSLYEGGVRIPYIFRWTGKIKPGAVCDEPINSVDLYPTLVELAGGKPDPGYTLDGTSYVNLLRGDHKLKRPPLYWHFPGYLGSGADTWRTTPVGTIRDGDWKLMEFFETGKRELYNLRDDIGEKHDLAPAEPDKLKELHDKLLVWRKQIAAPMPTPNTPGGAAPAKTREKGRGRNQATRAGE